MPGINDFPLNPTNGQIYTNDDGFSWKWNGNSVIRAWEKIVLNVKTLNGLSGGVTLAAGTGITFSISGNTLTISATSITGPTGATGSQGPIGNTGPTGAIPTDYVISFNGLTGAVTGVTTSVANTFTALQTFNAGITTSGITLNGPIIASGLGTFNAGITSAGATFTGNVAMTSTSSHTGLASFAGGITTSGITLNGRITASGLGTFNAGITTSGITLNGNLVASGSGKFNDRVLTDIIAPTANVGNAGTLYINSTSVGGGGGAITYIGDTVGDINNTYIAVDDSTPLIILSAPNTHVLVNGALSLDDNCKMFSGGYSTDNNTANQAIFTYDGASYCGGEITITVQQGAVAINSIKTCRLLIANTAETVNHTEYGETVVGTDFVTFDVSISGGLVTISMSPTGNTAFINSHARVKATLFPVLVGI